MPSAARGRRRATDPFEDLVAELLAPLGGLRCKRMFGAVGLFLDERMFAVIDDGALYLKADDRNRPAYVAEGQPELGYERNGRRIGLGYWRLPERLLDERDELVAWAREAVAAAARMRTGKPRRARAAARREEA